MLFSRSPQPAIRRRSLFSELRQNALAGAAFLAALGFIVDVIAHQVIELYWPAAASLLRTLAEAMIVAAAFGFLFEFFGRKRLIEEAVQQAAGQVRAVSFGLYNFARSPSEINYGDSFATSSLLVISSRYSANGLIPYRDQLIERFKEGKKLSFIHQSPRRDNDGITHSTSTSQSALDFFKDIVKDHPSFEKLIEFYESKRTFTYNFVAIDEGIWIKLYYNEKSEHAPPAFFAQRRSDFHELYRVDISNLIAKSSIIWLTDSTAKTTSSFTEEAK